MADDPPIHGDDYVLDMEAPSQATRETEEIGYTPVTCGPDDFARSGYTLRDYGGDTELFIAITMCDENEALFSRTTNTVMKNVGHLCSLNEFGTWGRDGWKKVVLCIISDGRSKINKGTLKTLENMECYEERLVKDTVNGKVVTAHIFERTIDALYNDAGNPPVEFKLHIIFCLTEQQKKLNSHRWFFNAFCPLIMPKVCILLDAGIKLADGSIYELWNCFEEHPGVGGACGEVCVSSGLLANPIAAVQNFEYKMSNIFDKPLESVFGYISCLPGAFSAYRYKALLDGPNNQGPLTSYFRGKTSHGATADAGFFDRNIGLAEDRILSFEMVTNKDNAWTLKHVKSARATTIVSTTIPEFISQQRESVNGSLFATTYAALSFGRIWTSKQGFFRRLVLQLLLIYNVIRLFFIWTNLANFYLFFFFLLGSVTVDSPGNVPHPLSNHAVKIVFEVILKLYISALVVAVVCSLKNGNRPQESKWVYSTLMVLFGFYSLVAFGFAGYLAGTAKFPGETAILLIAIYGMYFCGSLFYLDPLHMFTSFFPYIFFLPSYINVVMVYAICNLHYITWNTGGDNDVVKDLGDETATLLPASASEKPPERPEDAAVGRVDQDRNTSAKVVLAWLGTNTILIVVFTTSAFFPWTNSKTGSTGGTEPYVVFLYPLAFLTSVKFLGSMMYLIL